MQFIFSLQQNIGQIDFFYQGRSMQFRSSFGKNGLIAGDEKHEGDGKTPCGEFKILNLFYRKDKLLTPLPPLQIPSFVITQDMGWCDDVNSPQYNQWVQLPFAYSHEKLWREDGLYDFILILDYNINPSIKGKGSAIFLHIAKDGFQPTEGCLALARENLLFILPLLNPTSQITILTSKNNAFDIKSL